MSSGYSEGPTQFVSLAVTKTSFLGLVWGSLWVSFIFLLFRGYVRIKSFGTLSSDDFMILLAWTLLLVNAGIWQGMVDYLYIIYAVTIGAMQPPANMLLIVDRYLRRSFAVTFLNLCSLWAIKTSFLIYFSKLGHNVRGHKLVWRTAVVACIIGFCISIGVQNYRCLTVESAVKCGSPAYGAFVRRSLRLQAASDVITDGFILAIPFKILWNVQISRRDKTVLMLLFSLTIFTMVVAIIKVTLTIRTNREDDSWLYMWAAVEPAVAIIIASAISYRSLFSKDYPRKKSSDQYVTKPLRYGASSTQQSQENQNSVECGKESSSFSLGEEIVPLDSIHVRNEYTVTPSSKTVTPTTTEPKVDGT